MGLSRIEAEDLLARHADLSDYDPIELYRESDYPASLPRADDRGWMARKGRAGALIVLIKAARALRFAGC